LIPGRGAGRQACHVGGLADRNRRTENILTQGDTWDYSRTKVVDATSASLFDRPRPERIRLHLIRDEILSVACRFLASFPALTSQARSIQSFVP